MFDVYILLGFPTSFANVIALLFFVFRSIPANYLCKNYIDFHSQICQYYLGSTIVEILLVFLIIVYLQFHILSECLKAVERYMYAKKIKKAFVISKNFWLFNFHYSLSQKMFYLHFAYLYLLQTSVSVFVHLFYFICLFLKRGIKYLI